MDDAGDSGRWPVEGARTDDDQNDVLRQAEEAIASRQADEQMYPPDRAYLQAVIAAMGDDDLVVARWLLEVVQRSAFRLPLDRLPPQQAAEFAEHMPSPFGGPPHMRWFSLLSGIGSGAPPSWFEDENQRGALPFALNRAMFNVFGIEAKREGEAPERE